MNLCRCTQPVLRGMLAKIGAVCSISVSLLSAGEPVSVRLLERVNVSERTVRVSHVAQVNGGNLDLVNAIRDLDVTILPQSQNKETIRRERLQIRLLLAGYSQEDVTISGADRVSLTYVQTAATFAHTALDVEDAAASSMAQALGVPREEVRVKLAAPLDPLTAEHGTHGGGITIDVLPPVRPAPGRVRMTVRVLRNGQLRQTVSGLFDVRVRRRVALATASLQPGTVLTADHVTLSEDWSDERPTARNIQQLLHRELRRPIPAGEPISQLDLKPVRNSKAIPLVKARDIVRLSVRQGTLRVIIPNAEALQSGMLGETIRVRNMESRKIVVGRIISAGEVEVRLE